MTEEDFSPSDAWLVDRLREQVKAVPVTPRLPDATLLKAARKAAETYRRWAPVVRPEEIRVELRAAGSHADKPEPISIMEPVENAPERAGKAGDGRSRWSITIELRPDRSSEKILRFKAQDEYTALYATRRIDVRVGDDVFDLGLIDSGGTASASIPAEIDLFRPIIVRIGELQN